MKVIGMKNLGNTCFMNSVLQLMLTCNTFRLEIEKRKTVCPLTDFYERWKKSIAENDTSLHPYEFDNIPFESGQQHDAHEFLLYILEGHDKPFVVLGRYDVGSIFRENVISLPVEKTLEKSLLTYINDGKIYHWPRCLLVHFKRYDYSTYDANIKIPLEWRVMNATYKSKGQVHVPFLNTYQMKGAIVHSGDPEGKYGHYLTILNTDPPVVCDDETITEIKTAEFSFLLQKSYIVLYIRKGSEE